MEEAEEREFVSKEGEEQAREEEGGDMDEEEGWGFYKVLYNCSTVHFELCNTVL